MKRFLIALAVATLTFINTSCNQSPQQQTQAAAAPVKDTVEQACEPIKDPNNPKPMAIMMRVMAAHSDSMHSQLLRGESLDSADYPFLRFYVAEPTDPKVLEPQFFENARVFQQAHRELFAHPKEQVQYYNNMINACIRCHEQYCSGPLKRIRKFPIVKS